MAIAWLTVLKMVPWTDVISNAPVVADGAKKLWNAVAKKGSTVEADPTFTHASEINSLDAPNLEALQQQLAATRATVDDLRQQMMSSSELIKALAEQNTQLIERVGVHRRRLAWLTGSTVVLAIFVVIKQVLPLFSM